MKEKTLRVRVFMRMFSFFLCWMVALSARAADDIPRADVPAEWLRANLEAVLEARDQVRGMMSPLPTAILAKQDADEMQKEADQLVGLLVTINPESRVKVHPGPARIALEQGWPEPVLVKVINEGGVTSSLQVRTAGAPSVTARLMEYQSQAHPKRTLTNKLSGQGAEYQILLLRGNAAGRLEVKLSFDAGQGTADLGFRAEVPLLLEVSAHAPVPFYFDRSDLLWYIGGDGKKIPITHARDWGHRRDHLLASFERVSGGAPPARPAGAIEPRQESVVERDGVSLRKLTFSFAADDVVSAYLLVPVNRMARLPAILCLHQTTRIGKAEPAGLGGSANLQYALELARRGYVTLAPDYPGYGDDARSNPYLLGYASATRKGIINHLRMIDYLCGLAEVDAERIGCMGHSLGGHNTLFVGLFDERIKALATSCGFCSFSRYKGGHLQGWSHKVYMPRIAGVYQCDPKQMPFDFTEILAALAPRPVFINAPERDDNFDVEGVRECIRAARRVYQLLGRGDGIEVEHPDCAHDFPQQVRERCYKFFDRWLARQREKGR